MPERDSDAAEAGQQRDSSARNSGTAVTVVTRCENDEISGEDPPQRDRCGTDAASDAGQKRDKLENIKTHISLPSDDEGEAEGRAAQGASRRSAKRLDQHLDKFEEFRRIYPAKHVSFPSQMARKRWIEAMKRGEHPDYMLAGAKAYAAEQSKVGNVGTRFIKGADAWLHQRLWKDYAGAASVATVAPSSIPDEMAREWVREWKVRGGYWPWRQRSAPPDDPRTLMPRHILKEFGLATPGVAP